MALMLGLWLLPIQAQEQPPELEAIYKRGLQLYEAGKYAEAVPIAEEYIGVARARYGEQHQYYATGLGYLGVLYDALNRPSEAEPLFNRALAIKEKSLGPDHTEVADALYLLAELYRKQGRLAKAEPLYQRVLSISEKALGHEHPSIGIVLGKLAELYRAQGRDVDAEPLAKRSDAIREKWSVAAQPALGSGADEPARLLTQVNQLYQAGKYAEAIPIAESYVHVIEARHGVNGVEYTLALSNLAHLLQSTGRFIEAEPLMRRVLPINEKVLGPDHPTVATALNNLALLLQSTNRLAEAEPLYRRALAIDEKSLGPDHPNVARDINNLALLLHATNRLGEVESLMRRVIAIYEKSLGADHPNVATSLSNLADHFRVINRLAEAEPLMRRALAIDEKSLGPDHPNVAIRLSNLGMLLQATNRLAEAEPLIRRAVAISEKSLGSEHPSLAGSLSILAELLYTANRLVEAEPLMRRALLIDEKSFGPDHPNVAIRLNNLGMLLQATGQFVEAEPLMRRALAIDEKSFGPDHPNVALRLNNLAELFRTTNRLPEAEPLYRRALGIDEKSLGSDHPDVARDTSNLALLLYATSRLTEAEPSMRRVIAIFEKSLGADHPKVATALNNLALLLQNTNRTTEAEPLYRRALAIDEESLGPDHPDVARDINNLGQLLQTTNRLAEAEQLYRRALAINEKGLGPHHPIVANSLNNLAWLLAERDDWAAAADIGRRAKPILIGRQVSNVGDRDELGKALLASNTWVFRSYARATYHAEPQSSTSREDGFELAQWALQTRSAEALAQMSARGAKGSGPLAQLVRERQDMVARRQTEDKQLLAAVGRGDAMASEAVRKRLASLDLALDDIDVRLSSEFKDYAELANPKPLTIAATQALLNDGESLVLFLDTPQFGNQPGETLIWVVTRDDARWARIELASQSLIERTSALRCGLDRASWEGEGKQRCLNLLAIDDGKAPESGNPLPFDLTRAHQLYQALFGQAEDLIKGKHLLIVPSGPLTQIPFHLLVTEQPDSAATGNEAFRRAAWLAKSNTITVLPSVSSLKTLRENTKNSQATKPLVGFGNPLLNGRDANDGLRVELARARQRCAQAPFPRMARAIGRGTNVPQQRGGLVDVADIRAQVPLPETADELCMVAHNLGVSDSDIWLGARASEREVKRLSDSGELANYRIVHFATHGALAGELKAGAEPGLILTPPLEASPEDDGYLSASEIAGLKLDADWVILSACNTAAGGTESAEALSGMSRAFFYAGARALLVSHWAVNSDATVKLITETLSTMAADKSVGRSEALRRSMVALIEHGDPQEAHPAYWAPFEVVGEGTVGIAATPSSASAAAPPPTTAAAPISQVVSPPPNPVAVEPSVPANAKKTTAARPRPKTKAVDWKKSIFER
jgi:tetratricopeptide (TPR) repeat protein/CHAT domain-containing protein